MMKKHILRASAALLLLGGGVALALTTTIQSNANYSWSPNTGWINWQGDQSHGAVFSIHYAFGNIYSANLGWITLGNTPADGYTYSNSVAGDCGVNVDATGDPNYYLLSGYAWSANAGWINFNITDPAYRPKVDKKTGQFKGYAWGANIGWLPLDSSPNAMVATRWGKNAVRGWTNY